MSANSTDLPNLMTCKNHLPVVIILLGVIITTMFVAPSAAFADEGDAPLTFVMLVQANPAAYAETVAAIQVGQGRITHQFPPQAIIAHLSADMRRQLQNRPDIALVLTDAANLALVDTYGPQARRLATIWNSLIAPAATAELTTQFAEEHPAYNDALEPPDLAEANQVGISSLDEITPGYYQTSEFMAGSVAVGIVLVESDGSVDTQTENWTADEKQQVLNEIVAALNWWAEMNPQANLSFVYDDHATEPLSTGVEPITRPYYDQRYWIQDAMNGLGFNSSTSYFTLVRDYNNALRDAYQTDWAFSIFVVDSSADADNYFSNGYFAYAYLGGPFMVMTYGNNGYGPSNMDAVAAHEIGHIFYALDQYASAAQDCDRRSGYLYIENQNSQYGTCATNEASIMRGLISPYTTKSIDDYAAGQIGWRDSDGDNIIDPLDTDLPVSIDSLNQTEATVTVSGAVEITPYPTNFPYHSSVTINTITGVRYRVDGGQWQSAAATDGNFNGVTENYTFALEGLSSGVHLLEVAAIDSAGNVSAVFATRTFTVEGEGETGLHTILFPVESNILSQSAATINGVAFNMPGQAIASVDYRINGGEWQSAEAQDGIFNSDYEPFIISFSPSQPGDYTIEAFATDAAGNQETDIAVTQIEISGSQSFNVFLPVVIR